MVVMALSTSLVHSKKSGDIIILGGHGWGHNLIKSGKKSDGDIIILGGWGGWSSGWQVLSKILIHKLLKL